MSDPTSLALEPNPVVHEAQARVCTGPNQTRPLGATQGGPDPDDVLRIILDSAAGRHDDGPGASRAQMGAFFVGMTLRRSFPAKTAWSPAEQEAFRKHEAGFDALPDDVRFIMNPDRGLAPDGPDEASVIDALAVVLDGGHPSYEQTLAALDAVLNGNVREALSSALLIGQRMNRETDDEFRAYLDVVSPSGALPRLDLPDLLHMGEPYDGSKRAFRATVFIAAVLAAAGMPVVLHGSQDMPPKLGVTDQQILQALGARTDLPLDRAGALLQDPDVGFAFVSQAQYAPGLWGLRDLRTHIKKRPAFATTEKAQELYRAQRNHMTIGFFHSGYEGKLLRLMKARGLDSGFVIKGDEGTSHLGLAASKPSTPDRRAVNFVEGFRRRADGLSEVEQDIAPGAFGFDLSLIHI